MAFQFHTRRSTVYCGIFEQHVHVTLDLLSSRSIDLAIFLQTFRLAPFIPDATFANSPSSLARVLAIHKMANVPLTGPNCALGRLAIPLRILLGILAAQIAACIAVYLPLLIGTFKKLDPLLQPGPNVIVYLQILDGITFALIAARSNQPWWNYKPNVHNAHC